MHGAHVKGYNTKSIGICLAGNFDVTLPTTEQTESLAELIKQLKKKHNIKIENISPHRDKAAKTCYGSRLSDDWARNLLVKKSVDFSDFSTFDLLKEAKKRSNFYSTLVNVILS